MKRFCSLFLAVVIFGCVLIGTERRAWGYVDPGTGLLALQGVASFVGTVAFYFRRRIRALFQRKPVNGAGTYVAKPGQEPHNAP